MSVLSSGGHLTPSWRVASEIPHSPHDVMERLLGLQAPSLEPGWPQHLPCSSGAAASSCSPALAALTNGWLQGCEDDEPHSPAGKRQMVTHKSELHRERQTPQTDPADFSQPCAAQSCRPGSACLPQSQSQAPGGAQHFKSDRMLQRATRSAHLQTWKSVQELQHLQALNVDMKGFIRTLLGKLQLAERDNQITKTFVAALTMEPAALALHREVWELEQYRAGIAASSPYLAQSVPRPAFQQGKLAQHMPEAPSTPPVQMGTHAPAHTPSATPEQDCIAALVRKVECAVNSDVAAAHPDSICHQ